MALGAVRDETCTRWQRGMDCSFDERKFNVFLSIIWAITTLLFLGLALMPVRSKLPSGPARRCLLLSAVSALFSSMDALMYIAFGSPDAAAKVYGAQLLASIGSVFLVMGFCVFAHAWCDVASAFGRLHVSGGQSISCTLAMIRTSYTVILMVHLPIALAYAITDYSWGPDFDTTIFIFISWLAISAVGLQSFLAIVMLRISRLHIVDDKSTRSFRRITVINFLEQVAYDICWIVSGILYLSESYNEHGIVQAIVYTLNFLLIWLMHAQILLFFTACDPDDPLYSWDQYSNLLALSECQPGAAGSGASTAATIGATEGVGKLSDPPL